MYLKRPVKLESSYKVILTILMKIDVTFPHFLEYVLYKALLKQKNHVDPTSERPDPKQYVENYQKAMFKEVLEVANAWDACQKPAGKSANVIADFLYFYFVWGIHANLHQVDVCETRFGQKLRGGVSVPRQSCPERPALIQQ